MAASPPSPDPPAGEPCVRCGGTDYAEGAFGPRTLILCSCCAEVGTHVECEGEALGTTLDEDMVDANWFCGEVRREGGREESDLVVPPLFAHRPPLLRRPPPPSLLSNVKR